MIVDLTRERLRADFYAVRTVEEHSPNERFVKGFVCEAGSRHLIESSAGLPTRGDAADPAG